MRAWLAALQPGELDEWWAYYRLEPWDMPREHWPDVRQAGEGADGTITKVAGKPVKMLNPAQSLVQMTEAFG